MPAVLANYKSVTAARLRNPDDQDWLMIRWTYDGWGYSPLTDITAANVHTLRPAWVFSTGEPRVHQAALLVNAGVMFVTSRGDGLGRPLPGHAGDAQSVVPG